MVRAWVILGLLAFACGESTTGIDSAEPSQERDADGDGISVENGDCDDENDAVHPGASEVCNGVDDDDCDDRDPERSPEADETCNGVDDDCDDEVDEDPVDGDALYRDSDGDGWGDAEVSQPFCGAEEGWTVMIGDCDDTDGDIYPSAEEQCDGTDRDCDGVVDFGHSVPHHHATVQDALDAVGAGAHVCLAAGTWSEDLVMPVHDVVLEGMEGSASTIIEGTGSGPVVTIVSGPTTATRLQGLTITGGTASQGAGLHVDKAGVTLADVVLTGNGCAAADCTGAGVYMLTGPPAPRERPIADLVDDTRAPRWLVGGILTGREAPPATRPRRPARPRRHLKPPAGSSPPGVRRAVPQLAPGTVGGGSDGAPGGGQRDEQARARAAGGRPLPAAARPRQHSAAARPGDLGRQGRRSETLRA